MQPKKSIRSLKRKYLFSFNGMRALGCSPSTVRRWSRCSSTGIKKMNTPSGNSSANFYLTVDSIISIPS